MTRPAITSDLLRQCMPFSAAARRAAFAPHLDRACEDFDINTPRRAAAFLAQIAHESGSLRYVVEIADGRAYEGRRDLGNTCPGDGPRYKGRGLLQITGRANYAECGRDLGLPLIEQPDLLEQPEYAALSAGWFWDKRNLNVLADRGDFEMLTRRINGGLNGWDDRVRHYAWARAALGDI